MILTEPIEKKDLHQSKHILDGPMVKGVVDIRRELVGIDAEMHADIEQEFLTSGSDQDDLWGINFYPDDPDEDFVEFDSMINIRPRQGNRSRSVEDPATQQRILEVVSKWLH